jgi:hypothetical protein
MIPNRKLSLNVSAQSGNFNQNEREMQSCKSPPRHQELNAACDRNKKLTAETRRGRENSWTQMNADKRGSMVQPLCQIYSPIKQENLSKKTRSYSVVLQRKGDEEKGALFS